MISTHHHPTRRPQPITIFALALALALTAALPATTALAAENAQPGFSLTVYNNDFAVVREVRTLDLPDHQPTIQYTGVAKTIDPTSVHFESLTAPDTTHILEQNYEFDLVNADKLLDRFIDRPIAIVTEDGSQYRGTLLSFDGRQIVLQDSEGQLAMIQRPDNIRNISFPELPQGLLTRPTLVWQLDTDQPGEHLTRVTYQATQINWIADYNAVLNEDESAIDLSGWVTLTNRSGAAYPDAQIKLIAGDVRRIEPERREMVMARQRGMADMAYGAAAGFEEKAFFEYHLYTLGRTSTINDNQVKQIELLSASDVPVIKRYRFEPGGRHFKPRIGESDTYKVNVFVELTNSQQNNLGMALPAGKVRVYKTDQADDQLEFIGEDQIDHTPVDEEFDLYVGDAFDLIGEYRVVDVQQGQRHRVEQTEIILRNHKDEAVTIRVQPQLRTNWQWQISDTSHRYKKIDAGQVRFDVDVPAGGQTRLRYTVNYRW
jgi:hypothetical protein